MSNDVHAGVLPGLEEAWRLLSLPGTPSHLTWDSMGREDALSALARLRETAALPGAFRPEVTSLVMDLARRAADADLAHRIASGLTGAATDRRLAGVLFEAGWACRRAGQVGKGARHLAAAALLDPWVAPAALCSAPLDGIADHVRAGPVAFASVDGACLVRAIEGDVEAAEALFAGLKDPANDGPAAFAMLLAARMDGATAATGSSVIASVADDASALPWSPWIPADALRAVLDLSARQRLGVEARERYERAAGVLARYGVAAPEVALALSHAGSLRTCMERVVLPAMGLVDPDCGWKSGVVLGLVVAALCGCAHGRWRASVGPLPCADRVPGDAPCPAGVALVVERVESNQDPAPPSWVSIVGERVPDSISTREAFIPDSAARSGFDLALLPWQKAGLKARLKQAIAAVEELRRERVAGAETNSEAEWQLVSSILENEPLTSRSWEWLVHLEVPSGALTGADRAVADAVRALAVPGTLSQADIDDLVVRLAQAQDQPLPAWDALYGSGSAVAAYLQAVCHGLKPGGAALQKVAIDAARSALAEVPAVHRVRSAFETRIAIVLAQSSSPACPTVRDASGQAVVRANWLRYRVHGSGADILPVLRDALHEVEAIR